MHFKTFNIKAILQLALFTFLLFRVASLTQYVLDTMQGLSVEDILQIYASSQIRYLVNLFFELLIIFFIGYLTAFFILDNEYINAMLIFILSIIATFFYSKFLYAQYPLDISAPLWYEYSFIYEVIPLLAGTYIGKINKNNLLSKSRTYENIGYFSAIAGFTFSLCLFVIFIALIITGDEIIFFMLGYAILLGLLFSLISILSRNTLEIIYESNNTSLKTKIHRFKFGYIGFTISSFFLAFILFLYFIFKTNK